MAGNPNKIALDTSFVLRLLTGEPVDQFRRAQKRLESFLNDNKTFVIADLVVSEVYFALQYHFGVPKKESLEQIRNFLMSGLVEPLEYNVCFQAIKDSEKYKAGFVDQLICGQYGLFVEKILSFDQAMSPLPKVNVLK